MATSKDRILAEIRRTTEENGGTPPGAERFASLTGISVGVWRGKYWGTWSDALTEAGFTPNQPNEAYPRDRLINCLVDLTRRNRRFPSYADLRMARVADPTVPAHQAFTRLGTVAERLAMLRAYVADKPDLQDVLEFLPAPEPDAEDTSAPGPDPVDGAVYMLKLGKHYKIGKSFRVPQRHREIAIELPEKPDIVHVIATDDPTGIEVYWHGRFAAKRTNGEWFALDAADVRAFRRRKFM